MEKLPAVVQAEHVDAYVIRLTFSDGVVADVDFKEWLDGPVFKALHDPGYLNRFFVEAGTVVWPNGADIAPETLYDRARSAAA